MIAVFYPQWNQAMVELGLVWWYSAPAPRGSHRDVANFYTQKFPFVMMSFSPPSSSPSSHIMLACHKRQESMPLGSCRKPRRTLAARWTHAQWQPSRVAKTTVALVCLIYLFRNWQENMYTYCIISSHTVQIVYCMYNSAYGTSVNRETWLSYTLGDLNEPSNITNFRNILTC